ncbi:MAG: CTP synthase [Deinococcaceae bacterium]
MKYIFVTGGVVSSLGKGIISSSIGALLRARGHKVTAVKIDPYINIDAGTMRPYEHGEVFVTSDGSETDLDIGNYERFLDMDIPKGSQVTTGQVYQEVIRKERAGEYLSQTVQVVPHVTDEIKGRIRDSALRSGADICIIEVGGTVGDIESLPFLEAIRTMRFDEGYDNIAYLHLTLAPNVSSGELKTKPTQHSVAALRSVGISPDFIVVRSNAPIQTDLKRKIALFTSVDPESVFSSHDVEYLYEIPLILEEQELGLALEQRLRLPRATPDLSFWKDAVEKLKDPKHEVQIAFVGKYVQMSDAYLSIVESLRHAGIAHNTRVNIHWIDAEELEISLDLSQLQAMDGILIGPGFGQRGIEGKILAARCARENKIPYLGVCLGMQVAVIEIARAIGMTGANSTEFDPNSPYKVIDLMPEQFNIQEMGGTMRLGNWPMEVFPKTQLSEIYGLPEGGTVWERHRHRYEVNPIFLDQLTPHLTVSGITPGMRGQGQGLVEAIEVKDHPFFIGLQAHPEFKSRPMNPSPPFKAFVKASLEHCLISSQREHQLI